MTFLVLAPLPLLRNLELHLSLDLLSPLLDRDLDGVWVQHIHCQWLGQALSANDWAVARAVVHYAISATGPGREVSSVVSFKSASCFLSHG